jgi:hypothetical protein
MIKLITIKSELESAKRLGFETFVPKNGELFLTDVGNDDVVVRWGNSIAVYNNPTEYRMTEFQNVINLSRNIRLNCDKSESLKRLAEVVSVPNLLGKVVPDGKKAVVRYYEHSHGKDFTIQNGPKRLGPEQYATEFIETETEFRVWFCGGLTFCCKRVPLNEDDQKAFPCRSNWGYKYVNRIPSDLHTQTLKATERLGLEVGAADILEKDGKYFFLELNSAPSIDTNRLKKFYSEGLIALAKIKFPKLKI